MEPPTTSTIIACTSPATSLKVSTKSSGMSPALTAKVQFAYVMPSVDTNANDGASCPISPSPFPCEWDDTLSASDAACVPAVDYSVDNQMHCVANGHTRTYSITSASDVVGVVTMTDVNGHFNSEEPRFGRNSDVYRWS